MKCEPRGLAHVYDVAVCERYRAGYQLLVDKRAIGTAKIFDVVAAVSKGYLGVAARDFWIKKDDIVGGVATD